MSWECESGPVAQGEYAIKAFSEFVVKKKKKRFKELEVKIYLRNSMRTSDRGRQVWESRRLMNEM